MGLRTLVFVIVWAVATAAIIAVLLHDIATHEWIKEITPSFAPGGRPLEPRFAPAILFRSHPALGTLGAALAALLPSLLLARLGASAASRLRRAPGGKREEEFACEDPADHPPVVRNVRSSTPPLS